MEPEPIPHRFARYRRTERFVRGRQAWAAPEGGLCLNAFVIVTPEGGDDAVLLGRPDPSAPWASLAALSSVHLDDVGDRWILPASHLLEFETPSDAARRILAQQLGLARTLPVGPQVFSETYPSPIDADPVLHWDVHFVFRAEWPADRRVAAPPWRALAMRRPLDTARSEVARGHADVLALAGFPLRETPAGEST